MPFIKFPTNGSTLSLRHKIAIISVHNKDFSGRQNVASYNANIIEIVMGDRKSVNLFIVTFKHKSFNRHADGNSAMKTDLL